MRLKENICIKNDNEKNNIKYYFDNILIYFDDLKNSNIYIEIFLFTPLYLMFCFFEFTCEIMIIYY